MKTIVTRYFYLLLTFLILTILNTPTYGQRYWNVAAKFNGNDSSYIMVVPYSSLNNLSGSFTMECWLNADTNLTGSVFGKTSVRLMIQQSGNGFRARIQTGNNTKMYSRQSALLQTHKWYHIACTYDASGAGLMTVYVNGSYDTSRTGTNIGAIATNDSLYIGNSIYGPFKGMLDDIRIWNRALSSTEIAKNFRNPYVGYLNNNSSKNFGTGIVMSCTFDFTYSGGGSSLYFYDGYNSYYPKNVTAVYLGSSPSQTLSINNSLDLTNNGSYVVMPSNADIELTGPVSVEAWIYPTNPASGSSQYIIAKGNDYGMYLDGTGKLRFFFSAVGTSTIPIPANQWTHVAITCTHSGLATLYINGKFNDAGNAGTQPTPGTDSLFIGGYGYNAAQFQGYIDAVMISNYTKSEDEIKSDMFREIDYYNAPTPPNSTVSLNFDFYNYPTTGNGGYYFMKGNAVFSSPATVDNVPVSPVLSSSGENFPTGYYFTSSSRRIPQYNTAGYMEVDSLEVTNSTNISDIKMFIALNHQKLSDLQIILFSPDGDSDVVWNGNYGVSNAVDNLTTIFDDQSTDELLNGIYTDFGPDVKPLNSLNAAFAGKNPQGIWKLKIVDLFNGNTGFLYGWGLRFNNVTDIKDDNKTIKPELFSLEQNYPNPFNPSTIIRYSLPQASNVKLTIYDIMGRQIKELFNGYQQVGNHQVNFDGSNLSSGVYLYSIQATSSKGDIFKSTKKMILLK